MIRVRGPEITAETRRSHRLFEEWLIGKDSGVEGQIAVLGRFSQRHLARTGMQVDRLRTDHDYRVAMGVECLKRMEQRAAGGDKEVSVASRTHRSASIPVRLAPRRDLALAQ